MQHQRQLQLWGRQKQNLLENASVYVHNRGLLEEFFLAGLCGLGVGNICVVDSEFHKAMPKNSLLLGTSFNSRTISHSLVEILSQIWPAGKIRALAGPMVSETYSYDRNSYVFCRSGHYECSQGHSLFPHQVLSSIGTSKSPSVECILAGLSLDKFCSSVFKTTFSNSSSNISVLQNLLKSTGNGISGKYLVVGCGALGNFCASLLALEGAKQIDLIDPDVIEQSNLNRQILLYGRFGDAKAEVLRDRLKNINPQIHVEIRTRVFRNQDMRDKNYDCAFSCVDNVEARIQLSDSAQCYGTPLVNGGTSARSGSMQMYVPQKTRSLRDQCSLDALVEVQSQSCRESAPSVIIPNMVIGGLMVHNYKQFVHSKELTNARYSPDDGVELK